MAVTDSFVAFVLEQLDPLGPIASKRMFEASGSTPAICSSR
jgi:TfoX/Sxy family transcriptional regulator of competence genes